MKMELDEKLTKAHPNLYADRFGNMKTTCMCWGFECGDGWFDILWEASQKLEKLIIEYKKKCPKNDYWPRASQIKEKYGTLRFYLSSGTDAMYAITDKAEKETKSICEICGKPGKLAGRYWLSTVCKDHLKEGDQFYEDYNENEG